MEVPHMPETTMTKLSAVAHLSPWRRLPLKAWNYALNAAERKLGWDSLWSRPIGADIVTTKRCNLGCVMCIKYPPYGGLDMPMETFELIGRTLFKRLLYVRFCSGGEHLLHPHFGDMLDRCREHGCLVTMMTNGMLLDESWAERIVRRSSVWSIGISFDSPTEGTLESIRRGARFQTVLQNVRCLLETRRRCARAFPLVSLRSTLMRRNVADLPQMVRFAKELGVDALHAGYLITPPHLDPQESLWHHPELAARLFAEARGVADDLGLELHLPPSLESANGRIGESANKRISESDADVPVTRHPSPVTPSPIRCVLPWTQVYIDPNGDVRLCCNAWDAEGVMGNLVRDGFKAVWNGERYRGVRRAIAAGSPSYARCWHCPALGLDVHSKATHFYDLPAL